ncbi:FAD dependent oxidoreductase [Halorhabdus utahensis DSM 12940]|uniref:FAD dependent oxidoreductase n=1 Tax=Halorhabdus utahensis (strain DSM 12940 / JCM 11049 / AX-2) TaxID=519442 RepID=C7NTE7_HALUD|nr:NAD(P)/FAD-dependent oxidoreductase [Halorhabdus utahensis]ACV10869.1 FAD dependent oxidoreductase [Halorhabdus utahensis DSM 12940]
MNDRTDVAVIGGGVSGTAIARELSRYELDVTLLEAAPDVCTGTSKANTALLHAGFNANPDKQKGRLNVRGNELYHERIQHELDVPIEWRGALVVATEEAERPKLESLLERGRENGIEDLEIVDGERLHELEPHLTDDAIAALWAPTAGIVNPFELTVGFANNAVSNGATVELSAEVTDIEETADAFRVATERGDIEAQIVVNAAGLYADIISEMVGVDDFEITPRRGEYYLYDKETDIDVQRTVFPVPSEVSKGIVVTPTDEGNVMIGPNAEEVDDVTEKATTREGLDEVLAGAQETVPDLSKDDVIREFAGLRPAIKETGDFRIRIERRDPGFVNVAGIQSPGLASAPAVAELVVDLVGDLAGGLSEDPTFDPYYSPPPKTRHMSHAERAALIEEDPAYGQIICRCEMITEGEIRDAINEPVGARTINAIKRRVRPGAGRCQGGFCQPRVVEILAEEHGVDETDIKLEGNGSEVLIGDTKELLLAEDSEEVHADD